MRNGQIAGIVAAGAVLLWIVFGIALIPTFAAEFIGWRTHFWLELALECAASAIVAGVVLRSRPRLLDTPALWAWGAILIVLTGMVQGIEQARAEAQVTLQDTYYTMINLHYATRWGAVFCLFAGLYALFSRVTGFTYNRLLANLQLALMFSSFAVSMGAALAMRWNIPKRYADFAEASGRLIQISAVGAYLMAAGAAVFLVVLAEAFLRRRPA